MLRARQQTAEQHAAALGSSLQSCREQALCVHRGVAGGLQAAASSAQDLSKVGALGCSFTTSFPLTQDCHEGKALHTDCRGARVGAACTREACPEWFSWACHLQRMAAVSEQGVAGVREALQACSSEAASLADAVQQDGEELVQAMQRGAAADGSTADSLAALCSAGMAALDGKAPSAYDNYAHYPY